MTYDPLLDERRSQRLALGGLSSESLSLLSVGVGEVALNHGLRKVQLRGYPPIGVAADCEQQCR
jgi:hypothetical protein